MTDSEKSNITRPSFDLTYTNLPDRFYTPYQPEPAPAAKAVLLNHSLAEKYGLAKDWLSSKNALELFSGHAPAKGCSPIAMAYSGHQFGGFSPRLGDGRAALIGEFVDGENIRYDMHLKGSGRTPYSRGGDGKAALRAVLKEYIFSESLAALGVPTTRSLAAITTGETVMRQKIHPGAILVRTAKSHIRVGTFQYARLMQDDLMQDESALKVLADYTIERLYPKIDNSNPYVQLLSQVIDKQAKLVAKWMSVGFSHGVMNTDNMSISGETIDYGPCAFMEAFRPDQVFSSIDHQGRYAWNKQPEMAYWNLTRFAESLLPLLHKDEDKAVTMAETELAKFSAGFSNTFNQLMLAKLGLAADTKNAAKILQATISLLASTGVDFTRLYRRLTDSVQTGDYSTFLDLFTEPEQTQVQAKEWLKTYTKQDASPELMATSNPIYIPRFAQTEAALEAAENGELDKLNQMLDALKTPYDVQEAYVNLEKPIKQEGVPQQTFCET